MINACDSTASLIVCTMYITYHTSTLSVLSDIHIHLYAWLCFTEWCQFLNGHHMQADCGGLVSPGGLSFVGHTHELLGEIPAAVACKRTILDKAISSAAQRYVYEYTVHGMTKSVTSMKHNSISSPCHVRHITVLVLN